MTVLSVSNGKLHFKTDYALGLLHSRDLQLFLAIAKQFYRNFLFSLLSYQDVIFIILLTMLFFAIIKQTMCFSGTLG